ncbi:MAG TPA: TonB-dependent receptor, partial [Gemmatimonadaceae bacterium]|nr:TonB-dependent receptor [Gemmatimonadaceae bacterium]
MAALLLAVVAATAHAQTPAGRIVGRIIDGSSGQPLSDVGVQVVGTTLGAMSGVDGRYAVGGVPAGTVTLHVRRLGYQPKTVTGIVLSADASVEQDVALDVANVQLQAVEVTASAERGTVNEALDEQRNATGIVSAVTAEQISRSPDADAAAAVQRVSGVTVQDGKYVFVRGLGDRYTTASLNGARIPSPEPEKKVVPLDLFPASLLQTVTTSKTFTPDLPGDFSGAQVDIKMREFPARRAVSYSMSVSGNDAVTGKSIITAPTAGLEWLGFGGADRDLPGVLRAAGALRGEYAQSDLNWMLRSFRNAWSPGQGRGSPGYSLSTSIGGEDPVLGHRVGYLGSLTYSGSTEIRADEKRAQAVADGSGGTTAQNEYVGSTGRSTVLWGGLLNLSTWFGKGTKVSLNNSYSRTADNEAYQAEGVSEEFGRPLRRSTLRFVERSVASSQLRAEHLFGERQQLTWSVTGSAVTRAEPDRSDIIYDYQTDPASGATSFGWFSTQPARRTFSDLHESSLSPSLDYRLDLGDPARPLTVKLGGSYRFTKRDADNQVYDITSSRLSREAREAAPEVIFDGRYARGDSALLSLRTSGDGGSYRARDQVPAGYGMIEYPIGERVRLIAGARVESWRLGLQAAPSTLGQAAVDTTYRSTDLLPSGALNVRLTEAQNLRFSASRTLSRPEYRELAPIEYRDNVTQRTLVGNPSLRRALIQNYDVRWEWYPAAGEVLSVGAFAKRFDGPIEQVDIATSGAPKLTFLNAEGATNYGL